MKFYKNIVAALLAGIVMLLYLEIPVYASVQTIPIGNAQGYMDNPVSGSTLKGIKNVEGWFLDESGVVNIDVLVDGAVVGKASYGDARDDVHKAFPQYNNGTAGYHYALDTTQFTNGQHTVSIRATGNNGRVTTLPNSTIKIENNKGYALGCMDGPVSGAVLNGIKNVEGWFLDESGVANVEVLIDGVVVGQAVYGDVRTDVLKAYPQYNNGTAGFHYALDTTKFPDGKHTISIRVKGNNNRVTTLPNSTITIENTKGYMDNPVTGTKLKGINNLTGWFLNGSGVANIDVMVDGAVVGQATYGDARPDVHKAFPQYNNGAAGYHYALDTTQFTNGQHVVSIRAIDNNGHFKTLPNSTIMIENENPIGYLDNPASGSSLKGTQIVKGWFLDVNGVANIDVMVDGTVVGQAVYGDMRTDVLKAYPQYNNGTAGFHYALDTTKFPDGKHTISIRVKGNNNRVTTLPNSTITIENTKGYMDNPVTGTKLKGIKTVEGWFLDESGVAKIEVLVDGAVVGQAAYGDARTDILKAFPQYNNGAAGYHYVLDSTKYTNGQHTVSIRVTGNSGHVTTLPNSTITIENENPIGYMDNPVSGLTLKGTLNVSGWYLDVSGVEKIDVLVDGIVAGQAVYGDVRTDVLKAYPQYNNGTAGYHYALDTTEFSDGQHTVTIKVTGKNGRITTMPNSTVTIKNDNSKGYLDSPVSGKNYRGTQTVKGWFLYDGEVDIIDVMVDGTVVGQAVYGDARPDVQNAFPQYNNGTAGFHFDLDTTLFTVGKHIVTIRITGKNGRVISLPSSTVTFNQSQTVFLDPGHGGSDPGAMAGGYNEADLNLAVASKVQALLLERGYIVYMSRINKDTTVSLLDRSKLANDLNPDIFISLHHNSTAGGATSANGIESYYYEYDAEYPSKINGDMHNSPERISKSKTLTNLIHENLLEYTGANDRGTAGETFSVLRETAVPAALIELGFINNSSERQNLITDQYQNKLALAIADGIVEYFNTY